MSEIEVEEIIKHEGGKWVLYSRDGKKIMGRHDSEKEAKSQEAAIKSAKASKEGAFILMPGLALCEGKVEIVAGARCCLTEADFAVMTDQELQDLRKKFVGLRTELRKEHADMGNDKYCCPEGRACLDDICYYDSIIRSIEWSMQDRLLALDGEIE